MSKFYSESNKPATIPIPKSSEIEPEYKEVIDTKNGKTILKKIGETNVYKKIQEAADGVTLKEIINRYGIKPEDSIDAIKEAMENENVLDYTNISNNLIDNLNKINEAKNIFDNSSKEIKQHYNNNFNEFIAAAQSGELNNYIKSKTTPAEILPGQIQIEEVMQPTTPKQKIEETLERSTQGGIKYE